MERENCVAALRKAYGFTQLALALKIGVRKETISKIERGVQRITEPQTNALAKAFNCGLEYLYYPASGSGQGFVEEAVPSVPDAEDIASRVQLGDHEKWYQIKKSCLDQIGYFDGTHVVVDISRGHAKPKNW